MSDLPPHDRFPYGLDPERPRPWLDDEPDAHEPERLPLYCDDCGKRRSPWRNGPGRDKGKPRDRCNCNCGGQWVSHWAHKRKRT